VLRVVGLASSVLFNPQDPQDAHNRRISIIVMNEETAKAARETDE
jgi:chemotaxis protein MotB